jgi:hypothetical protein
MYISNKIKREREREEEKEDERRSSISSNKMPHNEEKDIVAAIMKSLNPG